MAFLQEIWIYCETFESLRYSINELHFHVLEKLGVIGNLNSIWGGRGFYNRESTKCWIMSSISIMFFPSTIGCARICIKCPFNIIIDGINFFFRIFE